MIVGKFDPTERVIWVQVRLSGPQGVGRLRFILDTGSPVTLVSLSVVAALGYSERMSHRSSRLYGTAGLEEGYRLRVDRLECLGFAVEKHEVYCHAIDDELKVDGLIGMDLLAGRVLTIDGVGGLLKMQKHPDDVE
jgi:predicted aspartyl protease